MNIEEIKIAIENALRENGLRPALPIEYDDSPSLVNVYPEINWTGGALCLIGIYPDRVQKWERLTPFNHTRGNPVGMAVYYQSVKHMVEIVQTFHKCPLAPCWK